MASGSVALLKVLASSVFTVKDTIHGIKNVGEITRGLEEEIEAFAFVLPILEFELHKSTPLPQNHEWWDETKISALVRNATKTFKRLQAIFDEIHRQRKALQNVREFYRSTQYDIEIQHLRLRITTYINALKIPVFLLAVYGNQNHTSPAASGLGDSALIERIAQQLEQSHGQFLKDIPTFFASQLALNAPPLLGADPTTQEDSEELEQIARSIVTSASIASTTDSFCSAASTARRDQGSEFHHDHVFEELSTSISVTGSPLSGQERGFVHDWIPDQPRTGREPSSQSISSESYQALVPGTTASSLSQSLYTPASTAIGGERNHFDLSSELRRKRIQRRADMMEDQVKTWIELISKSKEHVLNRDFNATVQILAKAMEGSCDIVETDLHPRNIALYHSKRLTLRLTFIYALRNTVHFWDHPPKLKTFLREILASPYCSQNQRSWASHLLADYLLHTSHCLHDLQEAKELCSAAIKSRASASGPGSTNTFESIDLLAKIYDALDDSDAEILRDMLPEDYKEICTAGPIRASFTGDKTGTRLILNPLPMANYMQSQTSLHEIMWTGHILDNSEMITQPWQNWILENPKLFPIISGKVGKLPDWSRMGLKTGDVVHILGMDNYRFCFVRNTRTKQVFMMHCQHVVEQVI